MDAIDRRSALRGILCVAAAASFGVALLPDTAEAMPLALEKEFGKKADELKHEAQAAVGRPPRRPVARPPHHRHRRRHRRGRRWVCWWQRGRRVCGWR